MQDQQLKRYLGVKDVEFIQIVTNIRVFVETVGNTSLMMLQVNGSSENTQAGIPFLRLREEKEGSAKGGLLEFDFLMSPNIDIHKKGKLDWEIKTVYHLDKLPPNPRAIKICAAENADIAMINRG